MFMLSYFPHAPGTVALMFIITLISFWGLRDELFRDRLLLNPYDVKLDRAYWRWITCGFVHGSPVHLFVNMLTLFFFGPLLEYELGTWGYLGLFGLGLLAGSIGTQLRFHGDSSYPGTVGASGAISAVVLGVIALRPDLGISLPGLTLLHPSLAIPAWIAAMLFLGATLFFMLRSREWGSVNHDAHFWGAVAGLVLAFVLQPMPLKSWWIEIAMR